MLFTINCWFTMEQGNYNHDYDKSGSLRRVKPKSNDEWT